MCFNCKIPLVTIWVVSIALLFSGCSVYIFGLSKTSSYGDLTLKYEADRSQVRVGEPVHMRFTIKNVGSKPWILESPNTPVMDIDVDVVGGPELLAWSTQNPDKISHRLEWAPGESQVIELTWIPKQEDVQFGMYNDVFLTGTLSENSKIIQSAGVRVCASNFCR
jgi:hypothetical protein